MKKLNLCSNAVKGVLALKDLIELESLDVSFNRIDNINQVKDLAMNKNLKKLKIRGNPFTKTFEKY